MHCFQWNILYRRLCGESDFRQVSSLLPHMTNCTKYPTGSKALWELQCFFFFSWKWYRYLFRCIWSLLLYWILNMLSLLHGVNSIYMCIQVRFVDYIHLLPVDIMALPCSFVSHTYRGESTCMILFSSIQVRPDKGIKYNIMRISTAWFY